MQAAVYPRHLNVKWFKGMGSLSYAYISTICSSGKLMYVSQSPDMRASFEVIRFDNA